MNVAMKRKVAILGAPLDLGAARRGVDMGPSAIRYAGLEEHLEGLGLEVTDLGNVTAELAEIAQVSDKHARYLPEILAACSQIAMRVRDIAGDQMPILLGGDHSIAMGTLAGLFAAHGQGGVMWVDAHGDLNRPETSPSGNVHGMPLAAALGACGFMLDGFGGPPWVDPSRVALVGIRSLDPGEKELVKDLGLAVFTIADIDRRGVPEVMREAIDVVRGPNFVHLSLDVDVCDPEIAPGVGTPVRGGLSYREAHLAMELIAEAEILTSLEVVEVNPVLDHADETGILAVELVASALGSRIL
ncbi:MAG: arginase [Actinomycetota bacterium]|jgi:arginase|nr:arginase [Actinomycetota bacterium]